MQPKPCKVFLGLVMCIVVGVGCTPDHTKVVDDTPTQPALTSTIVTEVYWPTQGWRISTPELQDMDAASLQGMSKAIEEQNLKMHSFLVVRHGYIVTEVYYPPYDQDTPHVIFSCTKSIMSALIGKALDEGLVTGLDQKVLGLFPEYTFTNESPFKESMTLADLLTMQSGLVWQDDIEAFGGMNRQTDLIQYILDKPMATQPGSEFNYCSGCSHLLSIILQRVTAEGTLAYARSRLFDPLGITEVVWETDRSGIPNGGWGLALTPRDMAKFGYLYLKEGVWENGVIVPSAWVRASTQQQVSLEDGMGYGYQWWVYPSSGMYAARGYQQQAIFVHRDLDLVVVITAEIDQFPGGTLLNLVEEYVVKAVLTGN